MHERDGHAVRRELPRPEMKSVVPADHVRERQRGERRGIREQARIEGQLPHAQIASAHRDRAAERSRRREIHQQKDVVEEQLDVRRRIA
ncbi:MAG TPA: hypothetical protein VGF48_02455 [Thermoanaerobaculia bacterium]